MKRRVLLGLVIATVSLAGCHTLNKGASSVGQRLDLVQHVADLPPPEAPPIYRKALQLLNENQFESALSELEEFQKQEPSSGFALAAELNAGRALEGLERWNDAAQRYRAVSVAAQGIAAKLQAMALYRLSFCHEALGDDQQALADLHDLRSRTKFLPIEVARAELPARLAAAYARVGNFDKALEMYQKAEGGIARLKRARGGAGEVPEWLPRTLYFMGAMVLREVNWQNFETALRPLARAQIYLLESSDFAVSPWSQRAARDLEKTYQDLWNVLHTVPEVTGADPSVQLRPLQKQQWQRAILMLANLQQLRARRLPGKSVEPTEELFTYIDGLSRKLDGLLAERPFGEGLTEAAKQRRAAVRGRVIAPEGTNSVLEQKFLESAQNSAPKELPGKKSSKQSVNSVKSAAPEAQVAPDQAEESDGDGIDETPPANPPPNPPTTIEKDPNL